MGFSKGITSEDTILKVSEFSIISHYFGIFTIPILISSPLRSDSNPSFYFYSKDGVKINYFDFGIREGGTIINLFQKLWGLSYSSTIFKLNTEVNSFSNDTSIGISTLNSSKKGRIFSRDTKLECKVREWRDHDLEYWESFGISKEWLEFGKVFPISTTIITKEKKTYNIPAEKYAYAYVEFKDSIPTIKIYQPYSTKHKWSNNHNMSVWDLWKQLPALGDKLIITSSRKDALCIWENSGIPSCSLQAEGYFPKEHVVDQLKKRFKTIYILYDNDFTSDINYGRLFGKGLSEKFGFIQIEIPQNYETKDISDFCKRYGRLGVKNLITQLTTTT